MSGSIDHEFDFVSISNGQTICQVKDSKNPEDSAGMEDEEDPSRKLPKVRTCLKVVCGDSFEAVFGSIRRMVWVMAVVICCFFMISQMSECLDKLSNPPISTQTRIIMKEEMDYPALTMCYKNSDNQGYDPLMFKHYNITRYWLMNDQTQESTWRNFRWGEVSLSEVWENITYPVVETSDSVQYQGHRDHIKSYVTSINNVGGLDYTYTFYHDHGRCYTIRPPKNVDKPLPGEKYGYKLYFYLQRSSNDSKLFDGEWQVHVHDADEWWSENSLLSYSHQETLYVKTGYRVFIRVTESVFNSLNRPQEPCDDVGATSYNENVTDLITLHGHHWPPAPVDSAVLDFISIGTFLLNGPESVSLMRGDFFICCNTEKDKKGSRRKLKCLTAFSFIPFQVLKYRLVVEDTNYCNASNKNCCKDNEA